jgi:hypothetical protein
LCLRLGHDRLNIEVIKTGLDALAGRYSTMPAGSYASRHPTSLCSQRRRCHAGSAVGGLLQTIRQYWSEQGMVQLPDWSRLRGRAVAWDDPHTPESQCNKPGSGELKRLATCVGRTNFMPPKSISACGNRAAKVRKVLIRFNLMRRKLRNPKPAQIPPRIA